MVALAECLCGDVVLWRSPRMALQSLRMWELVHFGIVAAFNGLTRYEALAYVGGALSNPVAVGFSGITSLQGFVTLILAYGVLIPNTLRRSLLVVAALAAVPLVALAAAVAANPTLREIHVVPLIVQNFLVLTFPAAIAVFAAAGAAALLRRAYEAERRAEQIGQYTLKQKLGEGGIANSSEVQAVTGLTHPNTVRLYDYGRAEDGSFYYVMEYLDGPTLDELVRDSGPLPSARVV